MGLAADLTTKRDHTRPAPAAAISTARRSRGCPTTSARSPTRGLFPFDRCRPRRGRHRFAPQQPHLGGQVRDSVDVDAWHQPGFGGVGHRDHDPGHAPLGRGQPAGVATIEHVSDARQILHLSGQDGVQDLPLAEPVTFREVHRLMFETDVAPLALADGTRVLVNWRMVSVAWVTWTRAPRPPAQARRVAANGSSPA